LRHLIRLYPKSWRERYGPEVTDIVARRRASPGEIVDLVLGALRAHVERTFVERLVFVPEFGFRPAGTRVLHRRVAATVARTTVGIVSAAAAPEQTDVLVESDSHTETGPDTWLLKIDRAGVEERAGAEPQVAMIVGGKHYAPLRIEPRLSSSNGYDLRALTFPTIAPNAGFAELCVTRNGEEWRLPFALGPTTFVGGRARVALQRDAIALFLTAVARSASYVAIALEAHARQAGAHVLTIGTGGGPMHVPAKLKTVQRAPAFPLLLEDGTGQRSEELVRMREITRGPTTGSADRWPLRVTSTFARPHADSDSLVVVVPCVVIGEQTEPVAVDLRSLPVNVQLGQHCLEVLSAGVSPDRPPRTRIVFQLPELGASRHLLGPGRLVAHGMRADMSTRGAPDDEQRMWIDTVIPDAPIVTLQDALVRVDGPWRLPIPPA
jgi:hypothetical protein